MTHKDYIIAGLLAVVVILVGIVGYCFGATRSSVYNGGYPIVPTITQEELSEVSLSEAEGFDVNGGVNEENPDFTGVDRSEGVDKREPAVVRAERAVAGFLDAYRSRDFDQATTFLTDELTRKFDYKQFMNEAASPISQVVFTDTRLLSYGSCLVSVRLFFEDEEKAGPDGLSTHYYVDCPHTASDRPTLIEAFPYTPPRADIALMPVTIFLNKILPPNSTPTGNGGPALTSVPITRYVPKTTQVAKAALETLLLGPSDEELDAGYFSEIPIASKLNSASIVDGEARPDFSLRIQKGGGSMSMGVRKEQIIRTLLQFPTVQKVRISIDGQTDQSLIFQP